LEEAKDILRKARELFEKTMIGDHTLRLRMQEAETLIRLGYFDEAYRNCLEVFEKENREINDYNELFFNTAHYNAGVIKYKVGDLKKSLRHFKDFAIGMNEFCKKFLSKEKYNQLLKENAFAVISDEKQIKECLQNALKIFSVVCMSGSEFISDYVG
jgi:tetratricopeptide (TPR) repeat protein